MATSISVFACEPQPIVVEGLQAVLAATDDLRFAGSAGTPEEALELLGSANADVILVSQYPESGPDSRFVLALKRVAEDARLILWVTGLDEEEFYRPLQLGFCGIIRKTRPVSTLLECLRAIGGGSFWVESPPAGQNPSLEKRSRIPRLTAREREIARLVAGGLRNKDIAETLSISAGTVKVHLMHIFEKMGVQDRFQLAVQARRLIQAEPATSRAEQPGAPLAVE